jgi:hypothetical protein
MTAPTMTPHRLSITGARLAALLGLAVLAFPHIAMHAQTSGDDAQAQAQADPPSRVARISILVGNVSVEPASVNEFSGAELNYPLTTGDRIFADAGANAELQTGQLAVRLGQQTDLTVTSMTDTLAQFGLASGSVHLRSFGLDQGSTLELDTPNVAVTVLQPGDVRVDVDPDNDTTVVWVASGQVQVDGNGVQQVLEQGQRVRLGGSDPVSAQWLDVPQSDGLDQFSADRDQLYDSSIASEQQYVSPQTIGAEDLSTNGDWETDGDAGPVWYPSDVAVGWAPHSCGRWAWIAPWGWTWVDCANWGFAPFHYGRWERRHDRWGWRPGPPVIRPIYAPALVVFVGGPKLTVGGAGVTAWFPLGPHEVYVPWYHTSPRYVNRINVSNIYDRNALQVRAIYNQSTVATAYASPGEQGYANRQIATVAVTQASFAAGRRVSVSSVHVSTEALAGAPVLPHPLVTPQRTMIGAGPARAVPLHEMRPALASHIENNALPATRSPQPATANRPAPIARQPQPAIESQRPSQSQPAPAERQPQPSEETARPIEGATRPQGMPAPAASPRPFYNRAVPPPPRPSFEEQQKAIESTDPGRPLSPQQMNNLRQGHPAGQPEQRETPHPAATPPRPAPAPRPSPAPRPAPAAEKKH